MSIEITIIENGPVIIQNKSDIATTVNGELISKKIAICRCGKSENGVYCDGSHAKKEE
jgi:CDGSH-type Zn-finger protein